MNADVFNLTKMTVISGSIVGLRTLTPTEAPTRSPTLDGYIVVDQQAEVAVVTAELSFALTAQEATDPVMLTSLQQLIDSEVDVLTWASPLLQLAADTAKGMAYLHDRQILHRDLKPDNVLLSGFRDADGRHSGLRAKVADFGESRLFDEKRNSVSGALTMTMV